MTPEEYSIAMKLWWHASREAIQKCHEHYQQAIQEAVAEEREACAKIAEDWRTWDGCTVVQEAVAAAIRSRGGKQK